jgi:hypothetical protein
MKSKTWTKCALLIKIGGFEFVENVELKKLPDVLKTFADAAIKNNVVLEVMFNPTVQIVKEPKKGKKK